LAVLLWILALCAAAAGAVLGALVLSLATVLMHALFFRWAFSDGQYVMTLGCATGPFGSMLGAVTGTAWFLLQRGQNEAAGWLCLIGGGLIAVLLGVCALEWCRGEIRAERWFYGTTTGVLFLGVAGLLVWGLRLLQP
jgi:hypothetical protein